MLVGVVTPGPRVQYRENETGFGNTSEEILARLEQEIRQALAAQPGAKAIGLGIPCTIDRKAGLAISAVNLPIVGVPVRDLIQERIGLPVFLDNDANVAALAEQRYGAARGARNAVVLTIGTGIGGGLVLDGRVYRGSTGAGAELGHVVVEAEGPPCQGNCPNHGCVETMASGTALARDGRAAAEREPESALGRLLAAGETIDGRAVTDAAREGDGAARLVVERAGYYLGVALSGFANVFDPDVIVLGGGVIHGVGDLLLNPARAELAKRALGLA
jgi:glucokinase